MNNVLYILMAPCPLCVKVGLPQNQMCSSQISKKVFINITHCYVVVYFN